jgi:formylglycine-generating enzyme required for sulfatase activity
MNDLFQKLKSSGPLGMSLSQNFSLAAFGKHPGWNDHFEGIGLDTEALAQVKQILYDDGVGGQINSGAWEKLESEKHLEGFHHTFLWLFGSFSILGEFWSSSDGKGRSKYPMVVCVQAANLLPGYLLAEILVELESLRGDFKGTISAEQVRADWLAARGRLQSQFAAISGKSLEMHLDAEHRQRFLEHADFGPVRVGLLRVLHQLGGMSGSQRHDLPSGQLRVPFGSDTWLQSLQLWAAFLQCAAPPAMPLLLIYRKGTNWIDIIVGKPTSGDFFCLQASPQALPLTTEVPYDLAPASKSRLQEWEARFLGADSSEPTFGAKSGLRPDKKPGSRRRWIIGFSIALLAAIAVAFSPFGRELLNRLLAELMPAPSKSPRPSSQNTTNAGQEAMLNREIKGHQAAFDRKDFTDSSAKVQVVMAADSTNPGATNFVAKIKSAQDDNAARQKNALDLQKYTNAIQTAEADLDRQDYAGVIAQADSALENRTNDELAILLKANAKKGLELLALREKEMKQQRHEYQQATNLARIALAEQRYSEATNQAGFALAANPGDSAAQLLMNEGMKGLASTGKQTTSQAFAHPNQTILANSAENTFTNDFGMQFVWVSTLPAGGAFVEKFGVTQKQYRLAMSRVPSAQRELGDDLPVANVPFEDAVDFCNRLSKWDGKHYTLLSRQDWLSLAGLSATQAQDAWQILTERGVLNMEVTSGKTQPSLAQPAHGGSRGVQLNGICGLFGNLREWDAEKESAGFSYDATESRDKKSLFLSGRSAKERLSVTGFRCVIRQDN